MDNKKLIGKRFYCGQIEKKYNKINTVTDVLETKSLATGEVIKIVVVGSHPSPTGIEGRTCNVYTTVETVNKYLIK